MDPAVATVAATAATTLVAAMTTDAWGHARNGFARLLRLERRAEGAYAEEELERVRVTVLAARDQGDATGERAVLDLVGARLGAVLEANAHRADELEEMLRDLLAGSLSAEAQLHALTEALKQRGSTTVYNQWVDNGGGGAQGSGATATVNNHRHHYAPGAPAPGTPAPGTTGQS